MPLDFVADFPLSKPLLPAKLLALLTPVGLTASEKIEVSCREDSPADKPTGEYAYMSMAVVPESEQHSLADLRGMMGHVVSYSVPVLGKKGSEADFSPTLSGYDYIVASWGDGSSYTYNLAEKVWMALGLTPRCLGSQEQRLAYDDLSLPAFGIAEGEVSAQFEWTASRDIHWWMLNESLRNYLWMRGSVGVRTFYYQKQMEDCAELRSRMGGQSHVVVGGGPQDWFEVDIREHDGALLLQVWAAVVAVSCERCEEASADGLLWPGVDGPVTSARANAWVASPSVFLDDRFLERYEQNLHYKSIPVELHGRWHCGPGYKGQWSFSDCIRVGRNVIEVDIRELYKPKPDREILHAHAFAITPEEAQARGFEGEHVASKTSRLLVQLLNLGDNLAKVGQGAGLSKTSVDWVGFDRAKLDYYGWAAYGQLGRLAQVAPLQMTQQAFLARCKSLHEIWQRVPDGLVRQVLVAAGVPLKEAKELKSLKLMQALLNIAQRLDAEQEGLGMMFGKEPPVGWADRNEAMAALFLNNDLRIADAHEAFDHALSTLAKMGFEVASLNVGYGKALDFVFDGVIEAFELINQTLGRILAR